MAKKVRRKIVRQDRVFYWYLKEDHDDCRLHLLIISDDRNFRVDYLLWPRNKELPFAPKNPFITVTGREFKGLEGLGGHWERFIVPGWEYEVITPAIVAEIIDWCLKAEEVVSVNYLGEVVEGAYLKGTLRRT